MDTFSKIFAVSLAYLRRCYRKIRGKLHDAKFALGRVTQAPPAVDKSIEVFIISPGGVASTMLLEYLSHYVSTNCPHDADGFKHLPFPPAWLKETGQKVIFISGDIDSICRSVEGRGWLARQGAKLGSFGAILFTILFLAPLARVFFKLAVRRQIYRWRAWCASETDQGLFIQYAEIWSSVERIAEFCGIKDPGFVNSFPKYVPPAKPPP